MRIIGGSLWFWLMRIPLICSLRNGIRLRTEACIEPGTSITSRNGDSTTCSCGVNGPDDVIATVGPASSETTVTERTSAGVRANAHTATQTANTGTESRTRTPNKRLPELWENLR